MHQVNSQENERQDSDPMARFPGASLPKADLSDPVLRRAFSAENLPNFRISVPGLLQHAELEHLPPSELTKVEECFSETLQSTWTDRGYEPVWLHGGFQLLPSAEVSEIRAERQERYQRLLDGFVLNSDRVPHAKLAAPDGQPTIAIVPGLFSGGLAEEISCRLGVPFIKRLTVQFPDSSDTTWIGSIRGQQDVLVVQQFATGESPRMQKVLQDLVYNLKQNGAKNVTVLFLYTLNQRDDRATFFNEEVQDRSYSSFRVMCSSLEHPNLGANRLMFLDLHNPATGQGGLGTDLLSVTRGLMERARTLYDVKRPLVIYPDAGSINRVHDRHLDNLSVLEEIFEQQALLIAGMKVRKGGVLDTVNLQGSPDGNVMRAIAGTDALVVEDILDTGGTAENILRALKTAGARRTFLLCTHATSGNGGVSRLINATFTRPNGKEEPLLDGMITSPSVRPTWSPFRTSHLTGERERVVHELDIREWLCQIILRHWGGQLGALRELSSGPFPVTDDTPQAVSTSRG